MLRDVYFLKAAGSQAEIYLEEGRFVVSSNLGDVLSQISQEKILIQCHRSYAINLLLVDSLDSHTIYLQNQSNILFFRGKNESFILINMQLF